MTLEQAITWTEINCNADTVVRLRSRDVAATLLAEVRSLKRQRDELLAALSRLTRVASVELSGRRDDLLDECRAAIAKVMP